MNRFYEIFVNKVIEVFDNHQESYQASDWEKLQQKMGKKQSRFIILLPYISKAAIIIIFLGLSVFILNKYDNYSEYPDKVQQIKTANFIENKYQNRETIAKHFDKNNSVKNKSKNESKNRNIKPLVIKSNKDQISSNTKNIIIEDILAADNKLITSDSKSVRIISINKNIKHFLIPTEENLEELKQIKTAKIIEEKPVLLEDEVSEDDEDNSEQKRFGFGFAIASLSNYSSAKVENDVNVGAGISASYKLTKKLRLSTGMLIAKQSLTGNENDDFMIRYPQTEKAQIKSENLVQERKQNNGRDGVMNSFSTIADFNLDEKKLEFLTIDIPLNLVYKYKKISFTSGVSSLLHVMENHDSKYTMVVNNNVYNLKTGSYDNYTNNTTVNKRKYISTNHFDFARLLNLSIGYGIDMKRGSIVVEPYIKIPIGTLSSQDIFMGAGGLALRYNFFK